MDLNRLDRHRVILGWCFVVAGGLGVLLALIAVAVVAGTGWLSGDPEALRVTLIVGAAVAAFVVLFSLPSLIAGYGLLQRRHWGKVLALIIGLLNVANVPFGTALFAYTLWFWLQGGSEALFQRRGPPPSLGPPTRRGPSERPPVGPGWPRRQPT